MNWFGQDGNGDGWFNYFSNHKHQNKAYQNIRFRYAFPDEFSFVKNFPSDLKPVAQEWYPILMGSMPNATMNWTRPEAVQANLAMAVRKYGRYWTRYKELMTLSMEDVFSNDIIKTTDRTQNSTSDSTTNSTDSSTNNTKDTNYLTNNEYMGDKDKFDDSDWKAEKYLSDGANSDGTTSSNSNQTDNVTSTDTLHNQDETKDTQYDPNKIAKLIGMAADPNAWIIENIVYELLAPIQIDYEYLDGWEGDYRE